jgi:uncharacterized protein YkwD
MLKGGEPAHLTGVIHWVLVIGAWSFYTVAMLVMKQTILALLVLASTAAGEKAAPAPLPVEQVRELNRILADFAKSNTTLEQQEKIAARVLEIGGMGPDRLERMAASRVASGERGYRKAFFEAAAAACKKKVVGGGDDRSSEVKEHRGAVLSLRNGSTTKEQLVSKGDPALKWLRENLLVTPQEVLESSESLAALRAKLLGLDAIRAQCRAAAETAGSKPPDLAARLEDYEEVAAIMGLPMGQGDRRTMLANLSLASELQREETLGIRDLNRMRAMLGIGVLATDVKLCEAARGHSQDMNEKKFFSHTSPVAGKSSPWDRAKQAGTTASAENIAAGARSGAGSNRQWFHSPGHMRNMLGGHRRMGLGRDGNKWTQMFGR